jgi:hypothetical protein
MTCKRWVGIAVAFALGGCASTREPESPAPPEARPQAFLAPPPRALRMDPVLEAVAPQEQYWRLAPQADAGSGTAESPATPPLPLAMAEGIEPGHLERPPPDKTLPLHRNPCAQWRADEEPALDMARRQLQQTVCGAALWFDGLFGDHQHVKAARGAYGRLDLNVFHSEFYGTDARVRFNARADLPNLENRLSVFVGRDEEDSFVRDRSEGFALRSRFPRFDDRDETIAGLGYSLPSSERFQTDVRAGVRLRGVRVPKLFAQTRIGFNAYSDERNLVHLRTTPFINSEDGLGVTSSLDYTHVLDDTHLLRWGTIGTVSQNTDGLDWRSALILYQALRKKRALAYEAFVRGETELPVPLKEFGLQTVYRQPLAKERLFGELIVAYTFPKEEPGEPRDGAFGVGFGLELPFGNRR